MALVTDEPSACIQVMRRTSRFQRLRSPPLEARCPAATATAPSPAAPVARHADGFADDSAAESFFAHASCPCALTSASEVAAAAVANAEDWNGVNVDWAGGGTLRTYS